MFNSSARGSVEGVPFKTRSDQVVGRVIAEFHKATIYVHGAITSLIGYRSFRASRVTLEEMPYAQYARAIRVRFLPRGKRKERAYFETAFASTVVVDGWIDEELPTPFLSGGKARYLSFDEGWNRDFSVWLESARVKHSQIRIVADLRGHDPQPVRFPSMHPYPMPQNIAAPTPSPSNPVFQPAKGPSQGIPAIFTEGTASDVTQTRAACLAHHGVACHACGFDFERTFGRIGAGFIHVHHLEPLAVTATEHLVDPIADLRPICPNCHAMLHRREPPLKIEELQQILGREAG